MEIRQSYLCAGFAPDRPVEVRPAKRDFTFVVLPLPCDNSGVIPVFDGGFRHAEFGGHPRERELAGVAERVAADRAVNGVGNAVRPARRLGLEGGGRSVGHGLVLRPGTAADPDRADDPAAAEERETAGKDPHPALVGHLDTVELGARLGTGT